ncbi:hypothetical protein ACSFA3_21515 [Variovorax sp. RHLX14]|uniref:hypothetical protein n=1 Tax=Variovorax sp. RHLX14 TaxID=1259731 RepID=UPI003F47C641
MQNKSTFRQPEFWDSAPSQLERLTHFSRLEEKQQRAEGWRRNFLYTTGFALALILMFLVTKVWR